MARKKEIDKQRILDAAYKLAVRGGIESLTARNIATEGCGAFFIDVEGEYTNLTKMLGGRKYC